MGGAQAGRKGSQNMGCTKGGAPSLLFGLHPFRIRRCIHVKHLKIPHSRHHSNNQLSSHEPHVHSFPLLLEFTWHLIWSSSMRFCL